MTETQEKEKHRPPHAPRLDSVQGGVIMRVTDALCPEQ